MARRIPDEPLRPDPGRGEEDRLLLETARLIREEFLNQNAFDETDQYTSLKKQALMLRAIMDVHEASREALARGASFEDVTGLAERELVFGLKDVDEKEMAKIERQAGEVCAAIEKPYQLKKLSKVIADILAG